MIGQVKLIEYPGNRQSIKLHQNTQILHDFAHNFILSAHCHVCSLADLGGGGGACRAHATPYGTKFFHFHIHFICGSRGGMPGACPPPMGPNSFIFAYIFTEKCPRWRSTPQWVHAPPTGNPGSATAFSPKSARVGGPHPPPPQWEILDPPLMLLIWLDITM